MAVDQARLQLFYRDVGFCRDLDQKPRFDLALALGKNLGKLHQCLESTLMARTMNMPDGTDDRPQPMAARTICRPASFVERIRSAQLRSEPGIANSQCEAYFCQREIDDIAGRLVLHRYGRTKRSKQGNGLLRP